MADDPMTLSDLQGYSSSGRLFKCDFSFSCAAVEVISADTARRTVRVP